MNKDRIMAIRSYFGNEWIVKEDVVDVLMAFISKEHLNSLANLISSGYSLEEIKDIEVYKNE
jgi:hypothetical protein|tara:strand:- start:394 stop:579 length:186 start_codon:yes stop_codon:yes gene_type:complete